jgi:hypothetical protein
MCLSHSIYTVQLCLTWCHTAPMPCSDHAVLLKATAQHGRRETACGLPAPVRLLLATTRSSTKVLIRRIPISDAGCQCETKHRLSWTRKRLVAAHYKKDHQLHCWTCSSDISGYYADFHEGHGTVWAGQGRGMAWARHGNGMLCVNRSQGIRNQFPSDSWLQCYNGYFEIYLFF